MASKITDLLIAGDKIIVRELGKYIGVPRKHLLVLAEKGILASETLVEEAIAVAGNLTRCENGKGQDYTDKSDAKKAGISWDGIYRRSRGADVRGLKNKKGWLRVVVPEPMENKLYFFLIPRKEYLNKNWECLRIPFAKTGGPPDLSKRSTKVFAYRVWTEYNVKTFEELCREI
jgi:hypothetical protein